MTADVKTWHGVEKAWDVKIYRANTGGPRLKTLL